MPKGDFRLIEEYDITESPWAEVSTATGRARCRICGKKIIKGEKQIAFYASFTDGSYNSWTSIECKVHISCAPHIRVVDGIKMARYIWEEK